MELLLIPNSSQLLHCNRLDQSRYIFKISTREKLDDCDDQEAEVVKKNSVRRRTPCQSVSPCPLYFEDQDDLLKIEKGCEKTDPESWIKRIQVAFNLASDDMKAFMKSIPGRCSKIY